MSLNNTIHLSIVRSHGQAALINALLNDLEKLECANSFQVTILNTVTNLAKYRFVEAWSARLPCTTIGSTR